MIIKAGDWQEAAGGIVEDANGVLWRIAGFIDRPAIILNPVTEYDIVNDRKRAQLTIIMGSPLSNEYHWLRRAE